MGINNKPKRERVTSQMKSGKTKVTIKSLLRRAIEGDCPSDWGLTDKPDCKFFNGDRVYSNDETIKGSDYCRECHNVAISDFISQERNGRKHIKNTPKRGQK